MRETYCSVCLPSALRDILLIQSTECVRHRVQSVYRVYVFDSLFSQFTKYISEKFFSVSLKSMSETLFSQSKECMSETFCSVNLQKVHLRHSVHLVYRVYF